jgi:hypothetical protein
MVDAVNCEERDFPRMKLVRIWLFDPGKLQHRTRISPDSTNDGAREAAAAATAIGSGLAVTKTLTQISRLRPRASAGVEWTTS